MSKTVGLVVGLIVFVVFCLVMYPPDLGHNAQATSPQAVTIDNGKVTVGQGADSPANKEAQRLAVSSGEVQVKKMDMQNLATDIEMEEMRAAADARKAANATMPPMNVYVIMPDGSKVAANSSNNSNSTVDNTTA